jgi:hypothetical protein
MTHDEAKLFPDSVGAADIPLLSFGPEPPGSVALVRRIWLKGSEPVLDTDRDGKR